MSRTYSSLTTAYRYLVKGAKSCAAFLFRWVYPAAFALVTLSVVIVTLAAYEFQTRITEAEANYARAGASAGTEAKEIDVSDAGETEAKDTDTGEAAAAQATDTASKTQATDAAAAASAGTKGQDADVAARARAELASELRKLQASYRVFRRLADERLAIFHEAERRVSDRLRPVLYAQVRKARHDQCPWLESLIEQRSASTDSQASSAMLTSSTAMADAPPAPPGPPSDAENAALTSALEAHREYLNYERLVYELTPNKEDKTPLFTLYQDMMYFDNLRYISLGLIDPMTLAVMPLWMLALIVTLAMGALGSCLHIIRSCLDETCKERRDYHPNSWFLFRPLLGIGTAFLLFVFVKAGLTLTEGKITEGNLNPYFIAVVAALSGFMSWQALASIQRRAERYFGEDEISKDRWAYGLAGTLGLKQKTPDELAAFLKEDTRMIELWMAEKKRVAQDVQERIADWLQTDRRHLFSDEK
jgi:hypothetical protein